MLIPALRLARDEQRGGKNFLRVLGRAYADPAPFIRHFLSAQYAEMIGRFKEAFLKALPHLHAPGAHVAPALRDGRPFLHPCGHRRAASSSRRSTPHEKDNDELLLQRLAPFLVAGLKAPASATPASSSSSRETRRR